MLGSSVAGAILIYLPPLLTNSPCAPRNVYSLAILTSTRDIDVLISPQIALSPLATWFLMKILFPLPNTHRCYLAPIFLDEQEPDAYTLGLGGDPVAGRGAPAGVHGATGAADAAASIGAVSGDTVAHPKMARPTDVDGTVPHPTPMACADTASGNRRAPAGAAPRPTTDTHADMASGAPALRPATEACRVLRALAFQPSLRGPAPLLLAHRHLRHPCRTSLYLVRHLVLSPRALILPSRRYTPAVLAHSLRHLACSHLQHRLAPPVLQLFLLSQFTMRILCVLEARMVSASLSRFFISRSQLTLISVHCPRRTGGLSLTPIGRRP